MSNSVFFYANAIADDKKVAVFLTVIGSKTYSLVRSLVAHCCHKMKLRGLSDSAEAAF